MNIKETSQPKLPESYSALLENIKTRIEQSQIRAAIKVNQELILLHWWIGSEINRRQEKEGWKAYIIDRLCKDIQSSFPGVKGFSRSNIFYMRSFYLAYAKVQQTVGLLESPPDYCLNIPWGHNIILINKIKNQEERAWYAKRAVAHGCSRAILEMWIETNLYHREGKAPSNFQKTLSFPHSDLAQQIIKDPYCFDFLTTLDQGREKEIEDGLMDHLQKFLLELGNGFAFVGRQVPLKIGSEDYYLDLLFYHIKLRCYFLIELKAVSFKPDFAGKMNFYLAAIDDKLRQSGDNPTIGLILCKEKDNLIVEYALRYTTSPITVANFEIQLAKSLPDNLKGTLPTVEEIEAELERSLPSNISF